MDNNNLIWITVIWICGQKDRFLRYYKTRGVDWFMELEAVSLCPSAAFTIFKWQRKYKITNTKKPNRNNKTILLLLCAVFFLYFNSIGFSLNDITFYIFFFFLARTVRIRSPHRWWPEPVHRLFAMTLYII